MTLHQIRILFAVAKTLSFTKAAEELHLSQSAVSQQIKLLEEELGSKLYRRTAQGIAFTQEGYKFLRGAAPILEQVKGLTSHFNAHPGAPEQETLVVAGSHGLAAVFLPSVLADFQRKHPHVEISLQIGHMDNIEQWILKSEIDIALMRQASNFPQIVCRPYRSEDVVLFVSPSHTWAWKRKIAISDFARMPLIIRGGNRIKTLTEESLGRLQTGGIKPKIAMRCESPAAVKTAVRRKLGLGILNREHVQSEVKEGIFKTIDMPNLNQNSTTFILYHRDRPLSPITRKFLAFLHHRRPKSQTPRISLKKAQELSS